MTEWYRNTDWSPEIAADFERRIARSRSQKAQHLSLQGHHLIARHPGTARELLERAVAMDDEFETPRAMTFLAQASLALGDIDAALGTYERAFARQASQPGIIAALPADYALLVGLFERRDRLPAALTVVEALPDESLFGIDPQFLAAKAMVFALAGRDEEARSAAMKALPLFAQMPDGEALGIDIAALRSRLAAIAA